MTDIVHRNTDVATAEAADVEACHGCGTPTHIDLLDAKPDDPANPDACDWTRLECRTCYGEDWVPALESQWPRRDRLIRLVQRGLRRLRLPYGRYAVGALG